MTHSKREKEKQQERCNYFINFIKNEGFKEKLDDAGNFAKNMPLFYKRVSENTFLVFNIPTFDNIKRDNFHADFWKVTASSEIEFLNAKLKDDKCETVRLSFDLEKDIELYKNELLKY